MPDLLDIYKRTLARCSPDILVQRVATDDMPRNVVAIGKCAGKLLDGFAQVVHVEHAVVALPENYPPPYTEAELLIGGHPQMTPASFAAGRRVADFVNTHDDITFLISGGGSACVEVANPAYSDEQVARHNGFLMESSMSIREINADRQQWSAIKGGKLGERVRGRCVTLVYSDVSTGRLRDVASGPSYRDMHLIADNDALTEAAHELMNHSRRRWGQLEGDVEEAVQQLWRELQRSETVVAGGEVTVNVHGKGRGGRCTEMALRFAMQCGESDVHALFASSDGVDGNSGAAGVYLRGIPWFDPDIAKRALHDSNSGEFVEEIGELIMIPPTGNNLRDLFLLARS